MSGKGELGKGEEEEKSKGTSDKMEV